MEMTRLYFGMLMSALLAGCLTSSPTECAVWNIECTDSALPAVEKPKFGVVQLGLVEMRAPYNAREIAVLRANGSIAFDPCNAYAAAPVMLLKGVALESLARSGFFSAVVASGSSVDFDVVAEVTVTRLALDCREDGARRAVAALSVRLVRSRRIVAYVEGTGSADASKPDFSAAFSEAVTSAFSDALNRL